jgi:NAD(P)-dependent dehydrogenase (short-subunit alcohol dehydrogenase family)
VANPADIRPIAVVTGGSRGIGAATALALARSGWDLCLGYRADGEAAKGVVAQCADLGAEATAVPVDVADELAVEQLFGAVDQHWAGRSILGALVNNAGIVDRSSRVQDMDAARLSRMFAVNVVGSFLCAGQAVRRMSTAHGGTGGVIVNVSSAASRLGSPGEYVDYAASKGAIDTMTLGLAKEVAAEGIRVVAVRPGIIDTEIHASGGHPDRAAQLADQIPLKRAGHPEEVASTIAWLCSQEASYITGAIIDVSGGR